jgi:hypothetical protein
MAKKCSKSAQNSAQKMLKLWTVTSKIFVIFLKSAFFKSVSKSFSIYGTNFRIWSCLRQKKREREKVSVLIFYYSRFHETLTTNFPNFVVKFTRLLRSSKVYYARFTTFYYVLLRVYYVYYVFYYVFYYALPPPISNPARILRTGCQVRKAVLLYKLIIDLK